MDTHNRWRSNDKNAYGFCPLDKDLWSLENAEARPGRNEEQNVLTRLLGEGGEEEMGRRVCTPHSAQRFRSSMTLDATEAQRKSNPFPWE